LFFIQILIISKADLNFWIKQIDNIVNFLLGISLGNLLLLILISIILLIDSIFVKHGPSEYGALSFFYLIILLIPITILIGLKTIGNLRRRIRKKYSNTGTITIINSIEFSIFLSHISVPILLFFIIEDKVVFVLTFLFLGWTLIFFVGLIIEIFRISIKKLVLDKFF